MDFDDVRFPLDVALGARGGPERRTEIVTLGSGFEHRNQLWAHSRRRYAAGFGIKTIAQLQAIVAFFEERRGRFRGFRFRDRMDWSSAASGAPVTPQDQPIGEGDGATRTFALRKTYGVGPSAYARPIAKPVGGSVRIAVAGAEQAPARFACDAQTGLVTFAPAHTPPPGALVSAGFLFDVPVRFDIDFLEIDLEAFEAGSIPDIPLIEVRL